MSNIVIAMEKLFILLISLTADGAGEIMERSDCWM